jgi:DNA (cytosine-5)-methyltransferase 1
LERSGAFETVAQCEIDPFCRRVLAKHWPQVKRYEDVRELTVARLAADGIAVDAICGGFPCQDLSVAGKRAGIEGERSGLWSEFTRLIGEIRPRVVFVENVTGLLSGPSQQPGGWFGRVLGDLAERGYDAEWENIPAAAVGHNHLRERVWIMAYPEQVGRICPVFAGNDAAQRAWGKASIWMPNGVRSQVGSAVPSVFGGWVDKPDPSRMADGVSDWPHRLGACGNAVVPKIPELLGRAYAQAMGMRP